MPKQMNASYTTCTEHLGSNAVIMSAWMLLLVQTVWV